MLYVFGAASLWAFGLLNFLWPLWDTKKQAWLTTHQPMREPTGRGGHD
jgi:hypothetical protein